MQIKGRSWRKILATFTALTMTLMLSVGVSAELPTSSEEVRKSGFYEDVLKKSDGYSMVSKIASRNSTALLASYGVKDDIIDSWNKIFCFNQSQFSISLDVFELKSDEPSKDEMTEALVSRGSTISRSAALKDEIARTPRIIEHVVSSKETIASIAEKYKLTQNTIKVGNGITNNTTLQAGKILYFPSIDGVVHTVKSGDSIWLISQAYGVSQNDIVEANRLKDADSIKVGQKIIIPGATKKIETSTKSIKGITFTYPVNARITSHFGSRWGTTHKGTDFGVPIGTEVRAAAAGTVSYSGNMSGFGKLIIIDHGNGVTTYYAHNSVLLAKVGQKVKQGEIITKSGNTGRSTGPHLHFEIRISGTSVDPIKYLL